MPTKMPRFTIAIPQDVFEELEDYRFEKRYASRSKATVDILKLGLEALKKQEQEKNSDEN